VERDAPLLEASKKQFLQAHEVLYARGDFVSVKRGFEFMADLPAASVPKGALAFTPQSLYKRNIFF